MVVELVVASWMCAVAAQPTLPVERSPLTSEAIIAAIGSEADAREVVRLVLGGLSAQQSGGRLFVLASQIREAWLPETNVPAMEIIRLTDAEIQRHLATCGDYWELFDVAKRDNVASMMAPRDAGAARGRFSQRSRTIGGIWAHLAQAQEQADGSAVSVAAA